MSRWAMMTALAAALTVGCAKGAGPGTGEADASGGGGGNPDAGINFPDAGGGGGSPDAAPMTTTLSQTTNDTITVENSVSCNNGDPDFFHQDNRYFRVFDLAQMGIDSAFNVTGVTFGIEQAAGNGGSQPINVLLHTLNGTPALANLTQIATMPVTVTDQTQSLQDVAITGTAPAGSKLVVEVHSPAGVDTSNSFFIGSNAGGESAPSYIVAPAEGCDITEMSTTGSLGFATMHVVIKVTGTYNP